MFRLPYLQDDWIEYFISEACLYTQMLVYTFPGVLFHSARMIVVSKGPAKVTDEQK